MLPEFLGGGGGGVGVGLWGCSLGSNKLSHLEN